MTYNHIGKNPAFLALMQARLLMSGVTTAFKIPWSVRAVKRKR